LLILNSTLSNATTVGAWTLSNPMAVGASILYDGSKGAVTSSVLITPNASQVAKVLRGGLAGYALTLAVEQLLGAVDWVLDPKNNQIKYKELPPINPTNLQYAYCDYIAVGHPICVSANTESNALMIAEKYYGWFSQGYVYCPEEKLTDSYYQFRKNSCTGMNQGVAINLAYMLNPFYNPQEQEKTLSLETVAQKVIENAESDNLDAQFAVLAAANNILSEAENDDAKAKPIEDELENNSKKCPNGQSRNAYGQCFICGSSALEQQMANDVQIAKGAHIGLGACKATHTIEELTLRYNNYVREAVARDKLNACYDIPHQTHLNQAKEAWRQAQEVCVKYMAVK
jgi:hypothetical protein